MNLNKFNLENKYSLITGAGGLLGEQHARALLEIKSNIILTDINKKKINNLYKTLIFCNKMLDLIQLYRVKISNN